MMDHLASISDWDRLKERGIVSKDFKVKVSKGSEFESFLQRQNAAWEKKKKIVAMGPTRVTTVRTRIVCCPEQHHFLPCAQIAREKVRARSGRRA